jgi:hypothetical protein
MAGVAACVAFGHGEYSVPQPFSMSVKTRTMISSIELTYVR